ncbi:MAG: hypothetical protein NC307_07115 [Roseburia sp.]|nr:hypothetical protein [Roseburia sp.]
MQYYKYVIVVLVYRNTEDIIDFIKSSRATISNFRIIIVNSFFDNESKSIFEKIAKEYDCDFLNVENKGYSYGNNCGIEFAKNHYAFGYLICSNPDIIIENFNEKVMEKYPDQIYGPEIITKNGKKQNPMLVRNNKFSYHLIYKGYSKRKKIYILLGLMINKLSRFLCRSYMLILKKKEYRVFQLHGSFLIFANSYIRKNDKVFDENLFLFGEEGVLAYRAERSGTFLYYTKDIQVFHKEDGSMKLFSGNLNAEIVKSITYFYENYVR